MTEQQAGERDLEDDQSPGDPADREPGAGAAAVAQQRIERRARRAPGRWQAGEDRGQERHADRDQRHAIVDLECPPVRAVLHQGRDAPSNAVERDRAQQQPDRSRERADHEAFCQQVGDQPAARGAERRTDGGFTHAIGRAREQEVRHVGARDQQHEADRDDHRPDELLVVADEARLERHQLEATVEDVPAHFRADLRRHRREILLGDVGAAVRAQSSIDRDLERFRALGARRILLRWPPTAPRWTGRSSRPA